jgi:hypothetical protein
MGGRLCDESADSGWGFKMEWTPRRLPGLRSDTGVGGVLDMWRSDGSETPYALFLCVCCIAAWCRDAWSIAADEVGGCDIGCSSVPLWPRGADHERSSLEYWDCRECWKGWEVCMAGRN